MSLFNFTLNLRYNLIMNNYVKKISLLLLYVAIGFSAFAQDKSKKEKKEARREKINAMIKQAEEGVLVFSKQSILGIQLRTNGYGAFYELGKTKTIRKT